MIRESLSAEQAQKVVHPPPAAAAQGRLHQVRPGQGRQHHARLTGLAGRPGPRLRRWTLRAGVDRQQPEHPRGGFIEIAGRSGSNAAATDARHLLPSSY